MLVFKWGSTKGKGHQLDIGTEMPPSILSLVLLVVDRNFSDHIFSPLHCIQSVPPVVTDRLYYITISRAMIMCSLLSCIKKTYLDLEKILSSG